MLKDILPDLADSGKLNQSLRDKNISLFGVPFGQKTLIAATLPGFKLYIARDYLYAREVYEQLRHCFKAAFLPPRSDTLTYKKAESPEIRFERLKALHALATGECDILIITAATLAEKFLSKDIFLSYYTRILPGKSYDTQQLALQLIKAGYKRESLCSSRGQFALRGDILDIYPSSGDPVRAEFFGDKVESLKNIDIYNYRSAGNIDRIIVPPAVEPAIDFSDKDNIIKKLEQEAQEGSDYLKETVHELIFKIGQGALDLSFDFIHHLSNTVSIADYFEDAAIIYDGTKEILDALNAARKEFENRYASMLLTGECLKSAAWQYFDLDRIRQNFKKFRQLAFMQITTDNRFFESEAVQKLNSMPLDRYAARFAHLARDIKNWAQGGYRVIIAGQDNETADYIKSSLNSQGAYVPVIEDNTTGCGILPLRIDTGFICHDNKVVLVGTRDILPKRTALKKDSKSLFVAPSAGDYVVHFVHGIGRCEGVTKLGGTLGTKDFIVISYYGGDKLYVPIEQADTLSKYSGEAEPRLSKMGGADFEKVKTRVKQSVKKMAIDLMALYAKRSSQKGYVYNIDRDALKSFEDRFAFVPTQDQLTARDEILADMAAGKIMDRLLCGDVGYGKTEVALRAAFITILNGKQVAFMSPTTILSEQHYKTICERMDEWGIKSAVLNRFKSAAEAKKILSALEKGEVNIISGTHRLLSKDVKFHDLGLLILDEEQRFGVADKEKIKSLKTTVNVLSLSATPIPRTLHMSLSGMRDISTLDEPPQDRLPVQTFVTELTDGLIKDAIEREISRGGQVFVLYNRIDTINEFASKIKAAVPSCRIGIAHGAMDNKTLQNSVEQFYRGETDVLVCTAIIENGIDIPSANTLIVADADRLGLAQLYQFRGRVGRSNRLAYAYFTYAWDKQLSEEASKRLAALTEFTSFGSGFKIAMRDLEIRGAGNVLGREQHGHIEKVGYEMYCRLLRAAVEELKGEAHIEEGRECRVEISADAYIPDGYMDKESDRMTLYYKIASIKNLDDRAALIAELKEIYGYVPDPVKWLINAGLFKGAGVAAGAELVRIEKGQAKVVMYELSPRILDAVKAAGKDAVLNMDKKPTIIFKGAKLYGRVLRFLQDCAPK